MEIIVPQKARAEHSCPTNLAGSSSQLPNETHAGRESANTEGTRSRASRDAKPSQVAKGCCDSSGKG